MGYTRRRQKDDPTRKPDLKLAVPDTLKVVLVDDWEAVTKNKQVRTISPKLYVSYTFSYIFPFRLSHCLENLMFKNYYVNLEIISIPRRRNPSKHLLFSPPIRLHMSLVAFSHIEALPTIIAGLQLYFDRSLGANLLYR